MGFRLPPPPPTSNSSVVSGSAKSIVANPAPIYFASTTEQAKDEPTTNRETASPNEVDASDSPASNYFSPFHFEREWKLHETLLQEHQRTPLATH